MKEATGELNLTVIVVVMIAILVSFFFFTLWPVLRQNINSTSQCSKAICVCKGGINKKTGVCDSQIASCYIAENGKKVGDDFECAWKG